MRKYTMETHVRRVKQVLKKEEPCTLCPASRGYDGGHNAEELWSNSSDPCRTCTNFLGLPHPPWDRCPCIQVGKEEALKRAHLAVEKWEAEHKGKED